MKSHGSAARSATNLPAVTVTIDTEVVQARLAKYARTAEGAFSDATLRALRSDSALFTRWCGSRNLVPVPAEPETVAAFLDDQALTKKPATIRRYAATIAHIHRAIDSPNPCERNEVRNALKRIGRKHRVKQRQAKGLTRELLDKLLAACSDQLSGLRDRALLAVAYDTLCRRSELVALRIEDLTVTPEGDGTIEVRRSKTDQLGEGSVRYLAPDTIQIIRDWLDAIGLEQGELFRSVLKGNKVGKKLHPCEVARIYKRLAMAAGLSLDIIEQISAHSTRVGAAQDMAAGDAIDLLAIMQAGGWKSSAMPAHYTRHLHARSSGAARLAQMQHRAR